MDRMSTVGRLSGSEQLSGRNAGSATALSIFDLRSRRAWLRSPCFEPRLDHLRDTPLTCGKSELKASRPQPFVRKTVFVGHTFRDNLAQKYSEQRNGQLACNPVQSQGLI